MGVLLATQTATSLENTDQYREHARRSPASVPSQNLFPTTKYHKIAGNANPLPFLPLLNPLKARTGKLGLCIYSIDGLHYFTFLRDCTIPKFVFRKRTRVGLRCRRVATIRFIQYRLSKWASEIYTSEKQHDELPCLSTFTAGEAMISAAGMSLTVRIPSMTVKMALSDSYRVAHLEYCEKIHVGRDRYFRIRVLSPQTTNNSL